MKKKLQKDTIAARVGIDTDEQNKAIVPPLYLSTNYVFQEVGENQPYEYTRERNPTRDHLIEALCKLEGGLGGEVTSSGMAAISLVTNILELKSKVILPHDCYGGTFRLFSSLAKKGILEVHFVNQGDESLIKKAIQEIQPNLIWLETPSNPLLQVVDIEQIALLSKEYQFFGSGRQHILIPSFAESIDARGRYSGPFNNKYINGHSDIVGGAAITNDEEILQKLKYWANNIGLTGSPFDSYLILRGLRTLGIRMEKHERNAKALVDILANSSNVEAVYYPGLTDHPTHKIAKKQQSGFGGMLSFSIKGGLPSVKKFVKNIEILSFAESLGGFESLVTHPYTMSHAALSPEEKKEIGISEGLIRISAGLENTDDLTAALKTVLEKLTLI